ncbi:MAG: hypothetical protein ONB17_06705 [candidate division KSB1 bacterium]|nr:hypothetical protein [candidate division KSB1 bacterium]MDZ7296210.1 hypothetical protein [candidate division KSB1 bacterium]MDZ7385303.1 hypothetical protein [candidate division KSB1 bacterium]MDZ7393397.1 hypothetical protein [candidate division KSB1 bacterium]MDZ7413837.1 hypothetical protein [candidate division KSB1 bacterium]
MADSLDNARPLAPLPTDANYRVMPRVREQDRERRFDSLFQEQEGNRRKQEKELEQKNAKATHEGADTFERHDAAPVRFEPEPGGTRPGHLGQNLDVCA